MADSIYGDLAPTLTNENDATLQTLGTAFTADAVGRITHGRWYFPATLPAGTVDWVLYNTGGQALARTSFVNPVTGWNLTPPLASAVAYDTPGTVLVAAIVTPNRYVATVSLFNVVGITSGHLTAPATGDVSGGNGRFAFGADTYPTGTFSGNAYFADLVFEEGAAPPVDTATRASSAPTLTARRTSAPTAATGRTSAAAVAARRASTPAVGG